MNGKSIAERIKRRRIETVDVPGVGPVRIGGVSAGKFLDILELPDAQQASALAVACLLDEQDRPLFGSVEDFKLVDVETAKALIAEATKFNGLGAEPGKKLGATTEAARVAAKGMTDELARTVAAGQSAAKALTGRAEPEPEPETEEE